MVPSPNPDTVFPSLFLYTKVADSQPLFDVKFYPWPTEQDEQVFAVCGEKDIFVCRLQFGADPPFEILRWFKDPNPDHAYNTIVWTQDPITQSPQLAFAGASPKQVQFYDIESDGPLDHRALSGHGKGINDMAVSPISPNLIATASEDYTIRLWNMDPNFSRQPCVALFAGEGHRQPILACSFHPNGKWLLSSGLDTAICLWAVPDPSELERETSNETHIDPKVIYYPHFHSTEIHANYIDNAVFYGDLIFSRAALDQNARRAENIIMLWKIEGFDSDTAPPSEPPIPGPGISTRSSFPHAGRSRGFQRLMTFDMPHTGRFYLRFGLLHQPQMRPVLAMGNDKSRFCFWDLQKLEEGYEAGGKEEEEMRTAVAAGRKKGVAQPVNKMNLDRLSELRRQQGVEIGAEGSSSGAEPSGTSVSVAPEWKYQLGHSFEPLAPHHQVTANTALSPSNHFATTQIDWSPDGCWMVAVGDHGMVCIFHRDKSVV
ncbi:WD40 repeat-like protein [Hortaea werneckii]|uniref:Uncharacterized protein n=1 Tax=Hortaea werneckii EXF-2000 TaxID=1157616 RepID=A0A1Z5SUI9_HORWE|nr:WD40 repeat-like protein [Hortaea werneckii]OTA24451.1 hypothetical protein BTJ68_11969 [Hortaea werneckii EXF-2000]KAI6849331.1 WD40 repeat-like protein [Hortaea werneckii]KAI6933263.1 WD40 repeat-like protein [Hortaea werneckii]KAI6946018.1 WD40 repeat-like protein [Hortaea werneckii]